MKHKLLVIVVTYNAIKWIDKCFTSVLTSSCNPDLYVLDNGSTDGTISYIKERYPEIIFIESKENLGFGKGNNEGLKYAIENNYDYVYLLNQDAWVFKDTFEKLMNIFDKNIDYGIISPIQCQANLNHIDKNFLMNTFISQSSLNFLDDLYFKSTKELYEVPFIMAAHWMISKKCLLNVGGFSPTFPHYGEDCNYVHRIIYHKYKIGMTPYINVVHDREFRIESLKKKIYMIYIYNLIYLSDIRQSVIYRHFFVLKFTFKKVLELKTFAPFKCYLKSLSQIRLININNRKSQQAGISFIEK